MTHQQMCIKTLQHFLPSWEYLLVSATPLTQLNSMATALANMLYLTLLPTYLKSAWPSSDTGTIGPGESAAPSRKILREQECKCHSLPAWSLPSQKQASSYITAKSLTIKTHWYFCTQVSPLMVKSTMFCL